MFSAPALPSMPKGKGKKPKKGGKPEKGGKPKKGLKLKKGAKTKKGKPARRGRKSRYGEEEYADEDYEEEYADEDYEEEYEDEGYTMVPGTYMTDKYMELHPGYFGAAQGQSASLTKTGKPSKPPTAGVSLFQNPFGGNADAAMMLSPMVEYEKSAGIPMNFAVVILAILFISFVMMRK